MSTLRIGKIDSNALAFNNHVYLNPVDADTIREDVATGEVWLNGLQRRFLDAALGQPVAVSNYKPRDSSWLSALELEVSLQAKRPDPKTYKVEQFETAIYANFDKQSFTLGQEVISDIAGTTMVFRVVSVECFEKDETKSRKKRGLLMAKTALTFVKAKDNPIKITGTAKASPLPFGPGFNFEKMGIGGLDKEFASIFRRAFASRVYPPDVVSSIGITHVKGMLLYGPPGTGKTLIARKIGEMLNAREPVVVNGPEILNKFVGQSEENIRKLFAEAENEYAEKGDESELHIIIFDEIDAICKQRGSNSSGGTGVGDSVVNQLLSKMDGAKQINNILVIGMTNRKDMIDEALLRPGRFEVHVEIGLPDERGRVQILSIHTAKMRESGYLGDDVSLDELAKETKNYSGAEIMGLVRSATSFALNRNVDPTLKATPDFRNIKVLRQDFMSALEEVKPSFGADVDSLSSSITNGMINYGDKFDFLYKKVKDFVQQVRSSSRTPILSLLLAGPPGHGKTAFAAQSALESEFPFAKLLSPDDFVGYHEQSRVLKINEAFEDAYRSQISFLIIDDIERFLDYTPLGPRFSNAVLQALLILLKRVPPRGRKLFVVVTTSHPDLLHDLGLDEVMMTTLTMPAVDTGAGVARILDNVGGFSPADLQLIEKKWLGSVGVKKIILFAEYAKQQYSDSKTNDSLGETFLDIMAGSEKRSHVTDEY